MNKLEQTRQATELLDARAIGFQDWAARVLGEDYRDVYSDGYLRRAAKIFSIFIKTAPMMKMVQRMIKMSKFYNS